MNEKEAEAQDINSSISTIEGSISEQRKSVDAIKRKITVPILNKSEAEVDEELKNFDDILKIQLDKKAEFKEKLKNSEAEKGQQAEEHFSFLTKIKEDNNEIFANLFNDSKASYTLNIRLAIAGTAINVYSIIFSFLGILLISLLIRCLT